MTLSSKGTSDALAAPDHTPSEGLVTMHRFIHALAALVLLALCGSTAARSADPKKDDCMKTAAHHAELHCGDEKWKAIRVYDWEAAKYKNRKPFESYDQCYASYYATKISTCKD